MPISEAFIQTFGVAAGAFGICVAVLLQMVAARDCNPWHIIALFGIGTVTLMYNFGAVDVAAPSASTLHALAVLVTFVVEVGIVVYVWRHSERFLSVGETPILRGE
jgi:hypothetical protein